VSAIARSMTAVLEQLRVGLDQAGFEQRRQLVELLIDRVVVTDGQVEIRYMIPTTPGSTKTRFCHLRTDYFHLVALTVAHHIDLRWPAAPGASSSPSGLLVGPLRDGVGNPALAQQPAAGGVAVAPVGDQMRRALAGPPQLTRPRHPDGVQQWTQLGAFMALAGGDQHCQRAALAVAGQVDLAGQAAPATAQCLVGLGTRP
jgi:hypothetical protein